MMKVILLGLFLLATSSSYASVYECTVNGKTTFQSKPCSGTLNITMGDRIKENEAKNDHRPKYEAEYRHYYDSLPKPVIGMTINDAQKTQWGRPQRVSKSTSSRDATEVWYFSGDSYYERKELRFRNGLLTEIRE